jgi:phage FluMu protein Com
MQDEIRCEQCNKLLGKIDKDKISIAFQLVLPCIPKEKYFELVESAKNIMEIKCPRCGHMNTNKESESVEDGRTNG